MKNLKDIIQEKLVINKDVKLKEYSCQPQDKKELKKILEERLEKNENADLNDIDVSKIENMDYLFKNLDPHNIDISKWDVSNVYTMSDMFYGCKNFNCYLGNWNVENVIRMFNMFDGCKKFKGEGLDNWKLTNCNNLNRSNMFNECDSLKNKPSWYKE